MAVTSITKPAEPSHRVTDWGRELDGAIVLDSGNTDAGSTVSSWFRPGNVVVKRTSTGRYVEADDSNADDNTAPAITSSSHSDGNGVIALVGNHGTISVTTTTGSGTEANNATDLNADAAFAAHYVASSAGGELTITARRAAADEWFYIDSSTMATASFSEGEANTSRGTDADVRITEAAVSLADDAGTARNMAVKASYLGDYDESALIVGGAFTTTTAIPQQYKDVLIRRGCRFR